MKIRKIEKLISCEYLFIVLITSFAVWENIFKKSKTERKIRDGVFIWLLANHHRPRPLDCHNNVSLDSPQEFINHGKPRNYADIGNSLTDKDALPYIVYVSYSKIKSLFCTNTFTLMPSTQERRF